MSDKKNPVEKIPLDAKESFLRSVNKKKGDKITAPPEEKITENSNQHPVEDIPVLFDDGNEKEKQNESASESVKQKTEKNKNKNKKTDSGQKDISEKLETESEKNKSVLNSEKNKIDKKPDEHIYLQLPFVNLIPVFMALQSLFLIIIPFMAAETTVTFIFVTLFWISVLCSGGLMLFIKLRYKNEFEFHCGSSSPAARIYRFISVLNFFRNKTAKTVDIVFFSVTLLTIIFVILAAKGIFDHIAVTAAILSLFLLSLNFHVFFNDSIYEYSLIFKKINRRRK
ncbi:MAG: hypothetical protein IJ289_08220 [Clostridia bacterium]|nr:hypothetical protein [Clostridia bacterium]